MFYLDEDDYLYRDGNILIVNIYAVMQRLGAFRGIFTSIEKHYWLSSIFNSGLNEFNI